MPSVINCNVVCLMPAVINCNVVCLMLAIINCNVVCFMPAVINLFQRHIFIEINNIGSTSKSLILLSGMPGR